MKVQAVLFDLDGVIINSGADIALSVNAALEAFGYLSPVCIPTGSRFSILHIIMQLSFASLIISYSISFQPAIDFSRSKKRTVR